MTALIAVVAVIVVANAALVTFLIAHYRREQRRPRLRVVRPGSGDRE